MKLSSHKQTDSIDGLETGKENAIYTVDNRIFAIQQSNQFND